MKNYHLLLKRRNFIQKTIQEPIKQSVQEPIKEPIKQSIQEPTKEPIKPKIKEIKSGYFDYFAIIFNQKYPHSVNINYVNILHKDKHKLFFISTGHSFAEKQYITNNNIRINKTNNIDWTNINTFYSIDNNENDYTIGLVDNNECNVIIELLNKQYIVNSINIEKLIKIEINDILYKNSYSTGSAKCQVLYELKNNNNKYHKITLDNGLICLIYCEIKNGYIVKPIECNKNDVTLKQKYFNTILQSFAKNNIFKIGENSYFDYYNLNNLIQVSSIMGDSGAGYYKINNSKADLVGIGIGGCNILILSKTKEINNNTLKWDNIKNRLVFDEFVIEEIYKGTVLTNININ